MSDSRPPEPKNEPSTDEPTAPPNIDHEAMENVAREMEALIGRMIAFQEEMEPYLRLLAEPEEDPRPGQD